MTAEQQKAIQAELTRRRQRRDNVLRRAKRAQRHAQEIGRMAYADDVAVRAMVSLYTEGDLLDGEWTTTVSVPRGGRDDVTVRVDDGVVTLSSMTIELMRLPDVPAREI